MALASMTATFAPPPMIRTNRPNYMETIFRGDRSRAPSLSSSHRSADSVSSSVASAADSRYDAGSKYQELRSLSPAYEEDYDDRSSLRSFALSFSMKKPKWRLLNKLHRRNQPSDARSIGFNDGIITPRKMSMSPLVNLHYRQHSSALQLSPKPITPTRGEQQELSCRKCYYSIARKCNGWVLGGSHGDACEACLKAGFFGSP